MAYEIVSTDRVGDWVARQMGGIYSPLSSSAIGLVRNGTLTAGIIYEDWNGKSVTCHLAIRGRLTPDFLHAISAYAFGQLGVHKIIAPCYSDNGKAMRMLPKMGFMEEGRIMDGQPNGDIVIFTMTQEQCPYLKERYGKISSTACIA